MIVTIKLLTSTFIKWTHQNDDGQDNQEEQEKVEFHFHFVFFFRYFTQMVVGIGGIGALI